MSRRLLTTLLMVAFLAGQLAVVPHAHGASRNNQPSDHDSRPHVHLVWFEHTDNQHDVEHSHDHDRDHGHRHHGEHSHHEAEHGQHQGSEQGRHPGDTSQPSQASSDTDCKHDDHDSDAVYLAVDPGDLLLSQGVASPDLCAAVTVMYVPTAQLVAATSRHLADAQPPDQYAPSCPLYLALRALLI